MEGMITIIGAGIVGLASAVEVAGDGREVYVLEKNDHFGMGTSSRNSEVVHAGIYYPKGSLKAMLCVEGNRLIREICLREGIGYRQISKLVVAVEEGELQGLQTILNRGVENDVPLELLARPEFQALEPHVGGIAAILSPMTGIVDSHGLMRYFESRAKSNGVTFAYKHKVVGIERTGSSWKITFKNPSGALECIESDVVINAAGLYADHMAELAGIDAVSAGYRLHYCKGDYFSIDPKKSRMVGRLVYPSPENNHVSLGMHLVLDLGGSARLGPDATYLPENVEDYSVDHKKRDAFFASAKRRLPYLEPEDLSPGSGFSGIRPKLQVNGEPVRDFVIKEESGRGLPGLINLVGIDSPGLTSSPAIGKYVSRIVDELLH
jgi:L-2-hydroxyglutarate oxidase LhgO